MISTCKKKLAVFGAMFLAITQLLTIDRIQISSVGTVKKAFAAELNRQVEALDRGIIGVVTNRGVFISWRLLGTDEAGTDFNLYRNGKKIATVKNSTNYLDTKGSKTTEYFVRTVVKNMEKTQSKTIKPMSQQYMSVKLNKPIDTTLNGTKVTYSANDASVGDLDGDGEYEIVLKWNPSNAKDNSQSGYTSNVYLDAYKLNGKQLWRIDLGKNIRAGDHYTQFMVYDLDGDGKAEVACKTADGAKDGKGYYIGKKDADYRNSSGYILTGPEYLSVFSGETGAALTTVYYTPARESVSSWGDNNGNRADRYLACIAYLNGKTPSLVMCRGYYTRTVLVAYDFSKNRLTKKWIFDSNSSENKGKGYDGQGNHNLSVGDVDNDGYDEIMYGSMVVDHSGKGLYTTRLGHGDAGHLGDFDPSVPGLEYFQVHENKANSAGTQLRSAGTGLELWGISSEGDIGRGVIANMSEKYKYYLAWSSQGVFDKNGKSVSMSGNANSAPNFAIWWDGDLYRELLDGVKINKWSDATNGLNRILTAMDVTSCNGSKANPCLQADIFGDWREEVVWPETDSKELRIYTTTDVTASKFFTFMHDPVYRLGVAWQNVGYNQPPHTSFYIGAQMSAQPKAKVYKAGSYKEYGIGSMNNSAEVQNGKVYYIKSINSGKYLDVYYGIDKDNNKVQQLALNNSTAQKFMAVDMGNGYYQFVSQVGSKTRVLDVSGDKAQDGQSIIIYKDKNSDNQQFKLKPLGNGVYAILTKCSKDKSGLDVSQKSILDRALIQQWFYVGGNNQKWTFQLAK